MSAPAIHWLYRPRTRRWLVGAGSVVLALSVLAEGFVHLHPAFAFDAWFGFNAVYGFLTCVAMVLFAKILGWLIKRPDDYYGNGSSAGAAHGCDRSATVNPGNRGTPPRRGRSHGQLLQEDGSGDG